MKENNTKKIAIEVTEEEINTLRSIVCASDIASRLLKYNESGTKKAIDSIERAVNSYDNGTMYLTKEDAVNVEVVIGFFLKTDDDKLFRVSIPEESKKNLVSVGSKLVKSVVNEDIDEEMKEDSTNKITGIDVKTESNIKDWYESGLLKKETDISFSFPELSVATASLLSISKEEICKSFGESVKDIIEECYSTLNVKLLNKINKAVENPTNPCVVSLNVIESALLSSVLKFTGEILSDEKCTEEKLKGIDKGDVLTNIGMGVNKIDMAIRKLDDDETEKENNTVNNKEDKKKTTDEEPLPYGLSDEKAIEMINENTKSPINIKLKRDDAIMLCAITHTLNETIVNNDIIGKTLTTADKDKTEDLIASMNKTADDANACMLKLKATNGKETVLNTTIHDCIVFVSIVTSVVELGMFTGEVAESAMRLSETIRSLSSLEYAKYLVGVAKDNYNSKD